MRKKNDLTIGEALQLMLQEYNLKSRVDESRVKLLWGQVMGKTVATYTSQIYVKNKVLHVTILSAPLKQELSFSKAKIIQRINEEMGEAYLKDVVIG